MGLFWSSVISILKTVTIVDILDIVIVAYLISKAVKLVRETRAEQLVKGIVLLAVSYLLAEQVGLKTVSFVLRYVFEYGMIALLVVFQPELRRALEQMGRTKLSNFNVFGAGNMDEEESVWKWRTAISMICNASASLSRQKIGALMVIERQTKLGEIIKTGTVINSDPSAELIGNIFFPNSPLHDGAMIIRGGKLYAAGCFLPLSTTNEISKQLGTRHRAAIGMSENSDAVVIVVSEETGVISVAMNGNLQRGFDAHTLSQLLEKELLPDQNGANGERKLAFWRVKK
ncbi:diadenylate cyclase CdaA [Zongyangia hominis]|uniref:Diadenylate cyclase n=1 Tax=Zongyangia hominis TaxID=2763677 RepID=A0A926IA41_9FIRM|nr:diadenylate cyclase CdaA [Zongyangia hominis]MBC8569821.1 TIGR00159 family protein [Zongyangia hominis]